MMYPIASLQRLHRYHTSQTLVRFGLCLLCIVLAFIPGRMLASTHTLEHGAQEERMPPWDNSAVILMYHNVAEDTPPSTSVSPAVFARHMQYLDENGFVVWPLKKVLHHLINGWAIPQKTVALTFDDAYRSVYTEALPVLKKKRWPFTVFVTARYTGDAYRHFMSWAQLREIGQYGGEVGNHSFSHPHFVRRRASEDEQQWYRRIAGEITKTQALLKKHLDNTVAVVAYPYGEYSTAVKNIVRELGYVGLGQQSGAVGYSSDFLALPRYSMATGYDKLEDFAVKVNTLSLPVTLLGPQDGVLDSQTSIPAMILRLEPGAYDKDRLRCYASGQGRIQIRWLNEERSVIEVMANTAVPPGRTRYNCTAPSTFDDEVFYWYSFQWMKPLPDGRWYAEH